MQKPDADVESGLVQVPEDQALGLDVPRIAARLILAVRLRIHAPKRPTLPILDRRRPIRIQNIALVEHSIDDLFDMRKIHGSGSTSGNNRSNACSQVGSP